MGEVAGSNHHPHPSFRFLLHPFLLSFRALRDLRGLFPLIFINDAKDSIKSYKWHKSYFDTGSHEMFCPASS
jgi:hypothetical protein